MAMIDWNFSSIETAAKVIFKINPNGHPNVESVIDYVKGIAESYAIKSNDRGENPSIIGVGGWYVTLYPTVSEEFDYGAEVTLMPYAVAKYLKMID